MKRKLSTLTATLLLSGSLSLLAACQAPALNQISTRSSRPARAAAQPAGGRLASGLDGGRLSLRRQDGQTRLRFDLNQGFRAQAFDCGAIATLQVRVEGIGLESGTTYSATPDAPDSCSFTTGPLSPIAAGRARIIRLEAYDASDPANFLGQLSAAVDLVDGQDSSFELSYRSTSSAEILSALISQADPRGAVYATRIGIDAMQDWVDELIGVGSNDSFPYSFDTHPLLLDAGVIAAAIVANGGELPDSTPAGAVQAPGEVVVNLSGIDTSGDDLRVWIKDPATDRVILGSPAANEVVTFQDVIPGQSWVVEVKQGTTVLTQNVIPNSGGSTPLSFDLDGSVIYSSNWSLLSGGPYAGHINQLVSDNAGNLIAATDDGGIYFSNNNGASWTQENTGIPTADLDIDSLATNPADAISPYVYAGTGSGKVFRRDFANSESSWTQIGSGQVFPGGAPINRLFVDRQDSRYVLAGGYFGGVAECLDSDTDSFTIVNLRDSGVDFSGQPITGFTEDDDGNYYFASKGFGVYQTTDPGAPGSGWTQLSTPSDPFITSIDFDSTNDKLQLGSYSGRFYTADAPMPTGWTQFTNGLSTGIPIWDILMGGNKIFAATAEALKKADDSSPADAMPDSAGFSAVSGGADPYVPENPNSPFLTSLVSDPLTPSFLFVGTEGAGVHYRTASSWFTRNQGLHAAQVTSLAKWGANSVLYAGLAGGGVMRSLDGGANWSAMLNVPPPGAGEGGLERQVNALLLRDDSSTHDLLMGTEAGVYFLDNANANVLTTPDDALWSVVGATGMGDKRVRTLLRLDNEYLLAGSESKLYKICMPGYAGCGAGDSAWTEILDGSTPIPAFSLAAHPDTPTHVYVGTDQGVYYNTDLDGSGSWLVNSFGASGQRVIALATTADDPALVWAGLDPSSAQSPGDKFLYKNTGAGGDTWAAVTLPSQISSVNSIAVSDSDANQVFIATNNGVYYSNDGGTSWNAFNDGPYSLYDIKIRNLLVDWGNETLYAGTSGHSVAVTDLSTGSN